MKLTHQPFLALTAAVSALFTTGSVVADFAPQCDTFHFTGSTHQSAPNTPFVGDITTTNLETGEVDTASVVTMLLGYVSTDGGRVVTSHEITSDSVPGYSPGYSFVTFDDAQLVPQGPGAFTLISHLEIKSGQGAYNCGELVIGNDPFEPQNNSTLTFDLQGVGTANYSGFSRLCRCKPSDN